MSEAPTSAGLGFESPSSRRLAAVWFIDISGYTALSARDEPTALAVVQLFQQTVRSLVTHHGGRLVKFLGDGALAEFMSADAAVRSALEIVDAFDRAAGERGIPATAHGGVHVGDLVTAGDGDIYGSGVNLTSRIKDEAGPGAVAITEEVWRLVAPTGRYGFEPLGERSLRGFPHPVRLLVVHAGACRAPAEREAAMEVRSLAVRPLEDVTDEGDLAWLADGLTREIVHSLGRMNGVRLRPLAPSGGRGDSAEADLDARLSGELCRTGERVRLEVRLEDPTSASRLWSDEREVDPETLPSLHREIVGDVVAALGVRGPDGSAPEPPESRYRPRPEAHRLYLEGRHYWNRHAWEDLERGVERFERAIAIDPGYALAHAGLADAWLTLGALFLPPREAYPRAEAAASRALDLDEHLAEAHAARAEARLRFDWDLAGAEQGFQRALELRPDYGEAQRMYANFLRDVGRLEEAIVVARQAEVLDPESLPIRAAVTGVLYFARRYEECVREVDRILEVSPWFFQPVFYRALALERLGRYEESIQTFQQLGRLSGLPGPLAGEAYVHAVAGRDAEARNLLARLEEISRERYVPAYSFASVHVGLGDRDAAFRWFERAIEERSSWMISIGAEPRFDAIRRDSRFAELLRRVGLVRAEPSGGGNLPAELTPTIGREREAEEVGDLLRTGSPLVTLIGPPGTGKTRLALHVARRSGAHYPDGAWVVELNPLRDPDRVLPEIARTLGVGEKPGEDLFSTLVDFLASRRPLLLLDGLERVLSVAPRIADLLRRAPGCQILATSRAPLRLRGEREYPVPPLAVAGSDPGEPVGESAAVRLFVDRARSVRPGFELDERNAAEVAEICRRLDGLPLAIELAAVRVKSVSPVDMLAWLDDRMAFLTEGPRDLPDHQRTLREAFDWSYDLLRDDQRKLLRALAAFAGEVDLDAATAVRGGEGGAVGALEGLIALADNSLLRQVDVPGGGIRFAILETVREYAALRLREANEEESARLRHARWFLSLAERAEEKLEGPEQIAWLDRLEREHANVQEALDWLLESGRTELAVRMGSSLWRFWWIRGHFSEMRRRLEQALSTAERLPPDLRANLWVARGAVASGDGDPAAAMRMFEKAVQIERAAGSPGGVSRSLLALGFGLSLRGDHDRAIPFFEEVLGLEREMENDAGSAVALRALGKSRARIGDLESATRWFEEALEIDRRLEDAQSMAFDLAGLASIAVLRGDDGRAAELYGRALALNQRVGSKPGTAYVLMDLAQLERRHGRTAIAREHLGTALALLVEIGNKRRIAACLATLAEMAIEVGHRDQAAHLLGFLEGLRGPAGLRLPPADEERIAEVEHRLIGEDPPDTWRDPRARGARFTLSQGIDYALAAAAPTA